MALYSSTTRTSSLAANEAAESEAQYTHYRSRPTRRSNQEQHARYRWQPTRRSIQAQLSQYRWQPTRRSHQAQHEHDRWRPVRWTNESQLAHCRWRSTRRSIQAQHAHYRWQPIAAVEPRTAPITKTIRNCPTSTYKEGIGVDKLLETEGAYHVQRGNYRWRKTRRSNQAKPRV